jgi:hypothetical protein
MESSLRVTITASPSTLTPISGAIGREIFPFGLSRRTSPGSTLTFTPLGILTGSLPMRDTLQPPSAHQTPQITSPPAFFSAALRPVVTPTEVVTIRVPNPPATRGSLR